MFFLSYCSEDNRILLNKIYAYPSIWLCIPVLATHLGIFVFVFSTENWKRPEREVKGILKALRDCLASNLLDWHAPGYLAAQSTLDVQRILCHT